jgi:hypothetical protein
MFLIRPGIRKSGGQDEVVRRAAPAFQIQGQARALALAADIAGDAAPAPRAL